MRRRTRYNPAGGIADFWQEFRRPNPHRWPILAASVLATLALLYGVMSERVFAPPEPPKVSYISTFEPGRTDSQIAASNTANQQRKERLAREQAARDEEVKDLYRRLGRATGVDVDAMERKIAEEKAAEAATGKRSSATGAEPAVAPPAN